MNYARAYFFFRYRSHFWLAARRCDCFEPLHFMYWGFVIASAFLTSLAASPRAMPNLVRQSMNSPKRRARSGAIFSMRFLGPKRAILFLEITYTHTPINPRPQIHSLKKSTFSKLDLLAVCATLCVLATVEVTFIISIHCYVGRENVRNS